MSNGLTGDYDVVVEISVAAVNRVLATVHQKGAYPDASPKFLHSVMARVGEIPKHLQFELAEALLQEYFGANVVDSGDISQDLLAALQDHIPGARTALQVVGRDLSGIEASPVGSGRLAEAIGQFAGLAIVRGTAKIQLGTPTISLSPGSTSEVTVHAPVRAHYTPDPDTFPLPEPIHGEVKAAFTVDYTASGSEGKPALEVKPSVDDDKIAFLPASGTALTTAETKRIAREIRRFLRTKFKPMIAELPDEFPFARFKALVADSTQVIALPLKLVGLVQPFALDSVTNVFLHANDAFALALSKDYVGELMRPALKQIEAFSYGPYKVVDPFGGIAVGFKAWASSATIEWSPGVMTLVVTGNAKLWGYLVDEEDYDVTIKQKLDLELDVASQTVSLKPVGDVSISGLPAKWKNKALPLVKTARDAAVASAQAAIQQELAKPRATFNTGLNSFAPANASYTALELGPDGVILRGVISVAPRLDVVVDVAETAAGTALTAFKSWIPAGTIGTYVWSWVTPDPENPNLPWAGTSEEKSDPHRFVFSLLRPSIGTARPRRIAQQVCMRLEGIQFGSVSGIDTVEGGTTCSVGGPPLPNMPAWWVNLMLPIWGPVGPDETLNNAIAAHISARFAPSRPVDPHTTSIIHFAKTSSAAPLPILSEALRRSRLREAEIPVFVVLPRGSFDGTRTAVERMLGPFARELPGPLVITEDYEGSWTKAFSAPAEEATYLMSGTGEFAWQHTGPLEARALSAALEQHGRAGPNHPSRVLRLGVRAGEPAPDAVFRNGEIQDEAVRDQHAHDLLLGRLRGRRVLLLFWKSWSPPCVVELLRLQRTEDQSSAERPFVLAIGDGEGAERVREIAREHDLRFNLVPDPTSRLATRFRVACWPTTVWIDERGLVGGLHFGATPSRAPHEPAGLKR